MNHLTAHEVALAMGGKVSPSNPNIARVPSQGHSRHDDGLAVIITDSDPEGFITYSHQGDDWRDCRDYVRSKLGLTRPEYKRPAMFIPPKPKGERTGGKQKVAEYVYLDQHGDEHHKVTRFEWAGGAKTFTQEHFDTDTWVKGEGELPSIPYNLPAIIARHDEPIWLVEGEKNADDLIALGFVATTAKGGSSAFPTTQDFAAWFDGSTVYALPDNDEPGEKWLAKVRACIPHAQPVIIPGLPPKGDVSDWIAAGGTAQALVALASSPAPATDSAARSLTPTPFTWINPSDIPQREVLYGSHLYRKFVSVTVSPGGVGKSSLVMMEAICMASNRALLGEPIYDGPLRVWYWNGEDPQDENTRRVVAAAVHHKISPDAFASRLWLDSGRDMQIKLADMARGELALNESLFLEMEQALIDRSIDVLVIDPLVSAHLVSENDNGAIDAIVKRLGRVAERAKCAIELVHHVRKPSSADAKVDVHDARGAGALIAGVRSARILNGMTEDEAKESNIAPQDRFSYFQVDLGKANLAKRDGRGRWRRLVSVGLGNSSDIRDEDKIGVVEVFERPAASDGFPEDAAVQAQRLAESRDTYRHWVGSGPPPGDWFGHAIARLFGMDETEDRKKVRRMIGTWIKAGVLTTREATNHQNNHVAYITSTRTLDEPTPEPTHETGDSPF